MNMCAVDIFFLSFLVLTGLLCSGCVRGEFGGAVLMLTLVRLVCCVLMTDSVTDTWVFVVTDMPVVVGVVFEEFVCACVCAVSCGWLCVFFVVFVSGGV